MNLKKLSNKCPAFGVVPLMCALMLAACGDDSTSAKDENSTTAIAGEVETKDDLPKCNSWREGKRYYVADEGADYLCENNEWTNLDDDDSDSDDSSKNDEKDDDKDDKDSGKSSSSTGKSSSSMKDESTDKGKSSSSQKVDSSDDSEEDDDENSDKSSSSEKEESGDSEKSSSSVEDAESSSSNELPETDLGECTESRQDEVAQKSNDSIYYYCDELSWRVATPLEYDTYQWESGLDGWCRAGSVDKKNYYVYDSGSWRVATPLEEILKIGCVADFEGRVEKAMICKNGNWEPNVTFDTLIDERDGQTYKTIKIYNQIWMAENLRYAYTGVKFREGTIYEEDSTSWCYDGDEGGRDAYGRFYTWSAVMDSAAQFTENAGTKCGYGVSCIPNTPHRGVCPKGWHVPTMAEYDTLYKAIGFDLAAVYLMSTNSGWNGLDLYGFSVLAAGERSNDGSFGNQGYYAHFWSATEKSIDYAWNRRFSSEYTYVRQEEKGKDIGY
ncbi:MAG: hypothetical protein HUK21_10405, partial [Fibrobacteraceae bacterium]|nr:hypothetical protein [Fibrobacteraceae bacterium]